MQTSTATQALKEILDELNISSMDALMNCGIIVSEPHPSYRLLYANSLFVKMLGYENFAELSEVVNTQMERLIDQADVDLARRKRKALSGNAVCELSFPIKLKTGERRQVTQRSCTKTLKSGREVVIATYFDAEQATLRQRLDLERAKLESDTQTARAERKFQIAMASTHMAVWECRFAERKNVYTPETMIRYKTPAELRGVPERLIAYGELHPDSEAELRSMYKAVMRGEPRAEGIVAVKYDEQSRWLKITMTTLYDDADRPESAICTAEDITREKLLLQQMEDELVQRSAYESELRAKGRFDLTENRILEYSAKWQENLAAPQIEFYSELLDALALQIPAEDERERFRERLCRENLLREFNNGVDMLRMEYRRQEPDGLAWMETRVHIMRQPSSGHLVSFLYTLDINRQKQTQAILNAVAKDSYEAIILINLHDGSYDSFSPRERRIYPIPISGKDYWGDVYTVLKSMLSPEAFDKTKDTRSPDYILGYLEENETCVFVTTVPNADGNDRTMKIQYSYLDESRQHLIATGMDITDALREEKRQKDALESALLAAKQASSAKTSFLSRMSHEIRTPLNAILGMTALAAQAQGNEEEVQECISKIGISGHFLLSLINDILDMSRIESGKMLLRNESFNFADFIESVTTVIYGQTVQKGLSYETIVSHGLEDGYIGDAMKLQQVLVNILGNAVKFTPRGGKVMFSVSLAGQDGNTARLRFAVNDTGCGIPEAAQGRIFEPFEQQDGSTTSVYGGTGLGLAISKNLVELMGGSIRVRSIVDVGSEFVVEVPLTIDPTLVRKQHTAYSFADLRTLIVDDDILVCEQTAKMLKEMGMLPEWVSSGERAVERVSELWKKHKSFDFILVDWKMPDMDGIETSRRIRKIVGPDVTIIIITAYDWGAIEAEARAAGVNMCISKPMLRSTLVSAFSKATGEAEHEKLVSAGPEIDFSGRRILLVEDHPLNAEIATRLLEKKHCSVELAENGLKALERFTTTPVGYYDAILMDIRMPIMDGVQAAINIRHWDKADAKTIPIVAMTANAFDEDVDRSKAAGMDAHLTKPIDAGLLYRVLYRLIG